MIAGLAQKYRSNQKSNSGKVMLKVEAENCMKECEQLRDSIIVDIKSITSKANTIV